MASVVDLQAWRREHRPRAGHPASGRGRADPGDLEQLERAVERLAPLVESALIAPGQVHPRIETELLAIIGELTVGLIAEATGRAERLARRLKEVR